MKLVAFRPAAAVVAAMAIALALFPAAVFAQTMALEDREQSAAAISPLGVVGARSLVVPHGTIALHGTLDPSEKLDAYEFVAPVTSETTVSLHFSSSVWLGYSPPTLRVASSDGEYDALGVRPADSASRFDWWSLERIRNEASVLAPLQKGKRYLIVVQPGTVTGATLPYVLRIGDEIAPSPAELARALPSTLRVWSGSYAQRSLRPLPLLAMAIATTLVLALALAIVGLLARLARRISQTKESTEPQVGGVGASVKQPPVAPVSARTPTPEPVSSVAAEAPVVRATEPESVAPETDESTLATEPESVALPREEPEPAPEAAVDQVPEVASSEQEQVPVESEIAESLPEPEPLPEPPEASATSELPTDEHLPSEVPLTEDSTSEVEGQADGLITRLRATRLGTHGAGEPDESISLDDRLGIHLEEDAADAADTARTVSEDDGLDGDPVAGQED